MIVATPPPNTLDRYNTEPHQWDALQFKQVEIVTTKTTRPNTRPRRPSLTVSTQEESLARHFVPKRRRLVVTMHVVVALLDLLKKVREKRAAKDSLLQQRQHDEQTEATEEEEMDNDDLDSIERRVSTMSIENTVVFHKQLQFSVIQVRLYEQIISDNPGSSRGPALGIGWRYLESEPISVDEYEERRPPRKVVGKDYRPLTETKRMAILRSQGYSDADLKQAVKRTDEARELRRKTIANLRKHHGVDTCAEKREEAALRLQRLTRMRRSSDAEIEQLWKEANSPPKTLTHKGFSGKGKGLFGSFKHSKR